MPETSAEQGSDTKAFSVRRLGITAVQTDRRSHALHLVDDYPDRVTPPLELVNKRIYQ
jgi:hypothetical protein